MNIQDSNTIDETKIRQTLSFRKIDGEWKIAHEHASVPFYMDGSFRAAIDLKPCSAIRCSGSISA
jgi:SnoaL-like domain